METQSEFKGYAVVEVMGHQRHIGYVETQAFGGTVLFRVDTPELAEREYTLTAPEYVPGEGTVPKGSKVKRAGSPAVSVLLGAGSIYRITPCSQEVALEAIDRDQHRALIVIERAAKAALAAPTEDDDADEPEHPDDDVPY